MSLKKPSFSDLCDLYIIFIIFGTPLLGYLPSLLRISPQFFIWGNIAISLILSALIIIKRSGLDSYQVQGLIKDNLLLGLFFMLYLYHMIYDLYVVDIKTTTFSDKFSYLLYTFFVTLIPSLGILFCSGINYDRVLKYGYILLFLTLVFSIWYNLFSGLEKRNEVRSGGNEVMGPLTYGHYGISFTLLSLFRVINTIKIKFKFLYVGGILLGLFVMYLSASRGPLVALIVCLLFFFVGQRGVFKGLLTLSLLILPFIMFWENIVLFLDQFDSVFIGRLINAIEYGDASGRDEIYFQGFSQFLRSPIIGDSFLISDGQFEGYYPHNLILEAFMTTGVIGAFFFLSWLFSTLKKSYLIVKYHKQSGWIPLLFVQYFTFGMSSKSFYTNFLFWFFAFLVIKYFNDVKNYNKLNF